eukprot:SAG31_NODE_23466_length_503_cov_9.037129_1_plen_65_part_10
MRTGGLIVVVVVVVLRAAVAVLGCVSVPHELPRVRVLRGCAAVRRGRALVRAQAAGLVCTAVLAS